MPKKARKDKNQPLTEAWALECLMRELADADRRRDAAQERFQKRMAEIARGKDLPLSLQAKRYLHKRIDGPITPEAAAAVFPRNGSTAIAEIHAWIKRERPGDRPHLVS